MEFMPSNNLSVIRQKAEKKKKMFILIYESCSVATRAIREKLYNVSHDVLICLHSYGVDRVH